MSGLQITHQIWKCPISEVQLQCIITLRNFAGSISMSQRDPFFKLANRILVKWPKNLMHRICRCFSKKKGTAPQKDAINSYLLTLDCDNAHLFRLRPFLDIFGPALMCFLTTSLFAVIQFAVISFCIITKVKVQFAVAIISRIPRNTVLKWLITNFQKFRNFTHKVTK